MPYLDIKIMPINCVFNLTFRMKGRVGSLVVSGYGFGSLVWIPLQTAFVNPHNINNNI